MVIPRFTTRDLGVSSIQRVNCNTINPRYNDHVGSKLSLTWNLLLKVIMNLFSIENVYLFPELTVGVVK